MVLLTFRGWDRMKLFYNLLYLKTYNKKGSIESNISEAVLDMVFSDEDINIKNVAQRANVSMASISAFVRKLGYNNFKSLTGDLRNIKNEYSYRVIEDKKEYTSTDGLFEQLEKSEEQIFEALQKANSQEKYLKAAAMLLNAIKIVFVGGIRPQMASFLEMELLRIGKSCINYISPIDQEDELKRCLDNENVCLVVFDIDDDKKVTSYLINYIRQIKDVIYFSNNNFNTRNCELCFDINAAGLPYRMIQSDIALRRLIALIRNLYKH